jgi:uncharacterized repeat protein (TIGR03806 family)
MRRLLFACALAICAGAAAPVPAGPRMDVLLAERPAPVLSAYGLFADASAHTPASGVRPYALATPLFSDYADKHRFVFLPAGERARPQGEDVLAFPVGATLIKTFAFPAAGGGERLIETRLLIHKRDGWAAYTYLWDGDGREARLNVAGARVPVSFTDPTGAPRSIEYAVPNRNQCKGCHVRGDAISPIGPKPRNVSQAQMGSAFGVVDPVPAAPTPATLDARARAYLDINCAHCHRPDGPASTSGLDLRYEQASPLAWGVRKRPVAAGRGAGDMLYAIDPGHPERSILLHRMESTDPGAMMPELGRSIAHTEGIALVREWISAMDAQGRVQPAH